MLLSICMYIGLPLLLSGTSYLISKKELTKSAFSVEILYISLVFSFFMGLRYAVGVDYFNYYNTYLNLSPDNHTFRTFEPFFHWLYRIGDKMDFTTHFIFIVSCFVQSYFYLKAFEYDKKLIPYAILFLFFIMIFSYLNIIRQCAAYSILLVAYSNISRKKYKLGLFYILLACLFHRSSFISLVVFLFLFPKKIIDNWKFQCLAIIFVMLFGNNSSELVFEVLNSFLDNSFFSSLLTKRFSVVESEAASGLGVLLKYFYYMCVFFLLRKEDTFFYIFNKRLFLIGCLIFGCFTYSIIFQRIAMIFQISQLLLLPKLVYEYKTFWKNKNSINKLIFLVLMFIILLLYVASIFGSNQECVPFQFNFGEI